MAFWNTTDIEPKRQFRFKVMFTNAGGQDGTFLAQSADRPSYTITDSTKVDFLDKSFHFPGKISWNQIKIKFVDAAGVTNVSQSSYSWLSRAGWLNPDNFNPQTATNFKTLNKANAVSSTGTVEVHVLAAGGDTTDKWTLKNAWITNVALNNLDYSAEGILTAEYTLRYDWAILGA